MKEIKENCYEPKKYSVRKSKEKDMEMICIWLQEE